MEMPRYNKKYAKPNYKMAQEIRKFYKLESTTMALLAEHYNLPVIMVSKIIHNEIFKQEEYGYPEF